MPKRLRVHEDPDGVDHARKIQQRLAHPHEHEVGDALVGRENRPGLAELIDNLVDCEVTNETHGARRTKGTSERAPHLGRDAQRVAARLRDQNGFDPRTVGGFQQKLPCPRRLNDQRAKGGATASPIRMPGTDASPG